MGGCDKYRTVLICVTEILQLNSLCGFVMAAALSKMLYRFVVFATLNIKEKDFHSTALLLCKFYNFLQ